MAWKEEKQQPQVQETFQETPKTLEDSIDLLEKKLKEKTPVYDYPNRTIAKMQLTDLKNLKDRYDRLRDIWISKNTWDWLKQLYWKIWREINTPEALRNNKSIFSSIKMIDEHISQEEWERKDTLIWKTTIRDYIEKYIKFDRPFNFARPESDFMTKFYDIFTFVYTNYLKDNYKNNEFENIKNSLWDKQNIEFKKDEDLDYLVEKTVMLLIEKWYKIENLSIIIWTKTFQLFDKKEQSVVRIFNELKSDIEKLSVLSKDQDLDDISKRIIGYEKLDWEFWVNLQGINELKNNFKSWILKLMKIKTESLKKYITTIEPLVLTDLNNAVSIEIKNLEKYKSKYRINSEEFDIDYESSLIRLIVKARVNLGLKIDIHKLEDVFKYIDEKNIWVFTSTLSEIIKNINESLNQAESVDTSQSLKKRIALDSLKNWLYEKLLDFYYKKARKRDKYESYWNEKNNKLTPVISSREQVSNIHLFNILTQAVQNKEIDYTTMREIIVTWYKKAFNGEFKSNPWKVKELSSIENRMKNRFSNEVWWELLKLLGPKINNIRLKEIIKERTENLYLISFIESSCNTNLISEAGGIWLYQITANTVRDYEPSLKWLTNDEIAILLLPVWAFPQKNKKHPKTKESIKRAHNITKDINAEELVTEILCKLVSKVEPKIDMKSWKIEMNDKVVTDIVDSVISEALIKYNWSWSVNLKWPNSIDEQRLTKEWFIKKRIIDIANILEKQKEELIDMKNSWSYSTIDAIAKIKKIHNDYFVRLKADPKADINIHYYKDILKSWFDDVQKWVDQHFRILNEYFYWEEKISIDDIIDWIEWYKIDILKQQFMYPEQYKAIEDVIKDFNTNNIISPIEQNKKPNKTTPKPIITKGSKWLYADYKRK